MPSESAASGSQRTHASQTRRFRRRELRLADGDRLVLNVSGSIDRVADDGTMKHSWAPEDADWPRQAIRFGLYPQVATVTPRGRRGWETRPPRR